MSKDTCPICGSDRMLAGPAYAPQETNCLDCGSQFNREVREVPTDKEISVAISEEVKFPEGGFSNPAEAMAHLAKLKEAAAKLGKVKVTTEDRPAKAKKKLHPTSDFPPELVMAETHYYQRKGEGWNEVLSTAKGERSVRNENVLIFVHNHHSNQPCSQTCREVIQNG